MKSIDKTLIIGPSWIGDMVMAQCLFQRIKKKYPNTAIDVFAPQWTGALTRCMPECDALIPSDFKHGQLGLLARFKMAKQFKNRYQRVYILPNSFKSALIPFWANIPERIAWRGEWRDWLLTHTIKQSVADYPLMVQRYVALIDPRAHTHTTADFRPHFVVPTEIVSSVIQKYYIPHGQKILALCPGAAFGPSKQWIASRFVEVALHYAKQGWQIALFGSEQDSAIAAYIAQHIEGHCINTVGKTNLLEAIALMSHTDLVLSHDSGLMHVAAALQKPVIALYGSSSPQFTPPLGPKSLILQHDVGCNPCFKRTCPKSQHYCMLAIHSNEVIRAGERILAS